jgi:hypothetical protein
MNQINSTKNAVLTKISNMKKLFSKTSLFAIAFVIGNLFFVNGAWGQATLETDLADYPPGSICTLTATGFLPGESVRMQVLHADYVVGDPITGADHDPWFVTADASGNFVTTWHVCEDDCVGETLRATADGQDPATPA